MIIVAGNNVYPSEVEAVLVRHPGHSDLSSMTTFPTTTVPDSTRHGLMVAPYPIDAPAPMSTKVGNDIEDVAMVVRWPTLAPRIRR